MKIPTFNMSFYMTNRSMYTIDAIRQGIRTATTRCYSNEINLIKSLTVGQPVRFIRTDKHKNIVDSLIVFAVNNKYLNNVYFKLPSYYLMMDNIKQWCELEGWDEEFAKAYLNSNRDKDLYQFTYSLYPPNYNYSSDNITKLNDNQVFIFGSNLTGHHGLGAAKQAMKFGAKYGQAEGLQGNSYGIITTDLTKQYRPSVDIQVVKDSVDKFIDFAANNSELEFLVTEIGCGLAGFTVEQIAPLFKSILLNSIKNIRLPKSFVREIVVTTIESVL